MALKQLFILNKNPMSYHSPIPRHGRRNISALLAEPQYLRHIALCDVYNFFDADSVALLSAAFKDGSISLHNCKEGPVKAIDAVMLQ